jgi:hypothetical protein
MVPRWEKLDAAAGKELASNRGAKPGQSKGRFMRLRDKTVKRAELKFREHLAAEMLIPQMRDPDTGERVTVANPNDWAARHNFGDPGIWEDYVWTGDLVQPGPDAMIRGELQPVFFVQSDFDLFIGRIEAVTGNIKEVHPRTAKNDPTSVAEAAEARLAAMQSSREPEADFHMLPSNRPTQPAKARAWQALKSLFQDGRVPKHLSISNLTGRVNSWLRKQSRNIADRPQVGESTVSRVLGLKK